MGEAVARFVAEKIPHKIIFKSFGVQDFYYHTVGSRAYLKKHAGLEAEVITQQIKQLLTQLSSSFGKMYSNKKEQIDANIL